MESIPTSPAIALPVSPSKRQTGADFLQGGNNGAKKKQAVAFTKSIRATEVFNITGFVKKIEDLEMRYEALNSKLECSEEYVHQLKDENDRLTELNTAHRRKEYWRANNIRCVQRFMKNLNNFLPTPCDCSACIISGRNTTAELTEGDQLSPCIFAKVWEDILNQYQIRYMHVLRTSNVSLLNNHEELGSVYPSLNSTAHLVCIGPNKYWHDVSFGNGIATAKFPSNPVFVRLAGLLDFVRIQQFR